MDRLPISARVAGVAGAVLAAMAVALSAYASHAEAGPAQSRLFLAAGLGLVHGVALTALAPASIPRMDRTALALLLAGTLLFCGSLVGAHFLGWPTRFAPWGGTLMIGGWLVQAVATARR